MREIPTETGSTATKEESCETIFIFWFWAISRRGHSEENVLIYTLELRPTDICAAWTVKCYLHMGRDLPKTAAWLSYAPLWSWTYKKPAICFSCAIWTQMRSCTKSDNLLTGMFLFFDISSVEHCISIINLHLFNLSYWVSAVRVKKNYM